MSSYEEMIESRIAFMCDTVGYDHKPTDGLTEGENKQWHNQMRNRVLAQGTCFGTQRDLYNLAMQGVVVFPGAFSGWMTNASWLGNQVFAIDSDNGTPLAEMLRRFDDKGVKVSYWHHTFSNRPEKEKLRLATCMDRLVTDANERAKVYAVLMGIAGDADPKCLDRTHYFNGTNQDGEFFGEYTNSVEDVLALWKPEYDEYLPEDHPDKLRVVRDATERRERTVAGGGNIISFSDALKRGITKNNAKKIIDAHLENVFDLRAWVNGDHRKDFVFAAYNLAKLAGYSDREAEELVDSYVRRMAKPLSHKEVNDAIRHAERHIEHNMPDYHEDYFNYGIDGIINGLLLTDDEIAECGILCGREERAHANKYREAKANRKARVIELGEAGYKNKEILEIVNREFAGLIEREYSLRSVQNLVKNNRDAKISRTTSFSLYREECIEEPLAEENAASNESLNEEQKVVYNFAMEGRNLAINARGGCGKSYVLDQIVADKARKGEMVGFCAATGLAAQTHNGCTVHHMFGIIPGEEYRVTYETAMTLLEYDGIVIDEVGMLDDEVFSSVCTAVRYMERSYRHHIQLIIAGDVLQLESVRGTYYFESPEYSSMGFVEVRLTQNMRQTNRLYDALLSKVQYGYNKAEVVSRLNAIYSRTEDASAPYVYAHRFKALQKNNEVLATLPGEAVQIDEVLTVKLGARVIVTANGRTDRNGAVRYYNGMQGTIKDIRRSSVVIEKDDGSEVVIKKQSITESSGYTYEGYPLMLGYALTIHKVQGMTFDSLNIDPGCFACGQLYTALSRVRTPEGVHLLRPVRPEYVKVNRAALDYVRSGRVREAV